VHSASSASVFAKLDRMDDDGPSADLGGAWR